MSVLIIAQFFIKSEKLHDFNALANDLVRQSRVEKGNVFYKTYQSTENKTDFIFYEQYKDDAGFKWHLNAEYYKIFADALKKLQSREPIVQMLN